MMKDYQKREIKVSDLQIRELEDGKRIIEGLIPYNSRSEWMGFYEYITPTAFNKTIADGADVRALWNHDTTKLLGRVKNGSLRLRSEADGLHIECDLPQTSYAQDVYNLIRGGYNNGLSFGFTTIQDRWDEEVDETGRSVPVCYLIEVRLFEVSFCVSFPAYEATDSEARNIRSLIDDLKAIKPETLSDEERQALDNTIRELLPKEDEPAPVEPTPAETITEVEPVLERQLDELLAELKKEKEKWMKK